MTRLWWVRHAPTHAKGMIGWTDLGCDLTDTARLDRLAAHLPDAPVISSDLARAAATADAIARGRLRMPHDRGLRELHFGDWEARRYDEIPADRLTAFYDGDGSVSAPGGESWNGFRGRVDAAVTRIVGPDGPPDVIVVAHMGTILTQVQRALDLPPYETFAQEVANLSVTRLVFDGAWRAERINHLP